MGGVSQLERRAVVSCYLFRIYPLPCLLPVRLCTDSKVFTYHYGCRVLRDPRVFIRSGPCDVTCLTLADFLWFRHYILLLTISRAISSHGVCHSGLS